MIITGHQPEYLPYLGFFYKMAKADKFILVDHLQFSKKDFHNRNRIRVPSKQGWAWLTVPVLFSGKGVQKINEVEIDNSTPWAKHHWQLMYFNYKKTPFFNNYADFFEKLYSKRWQKLIDLNETIIYYLQKELGIKTPIVKSSEYAFEGKKTDLIVELCKKFGADTYLSGIGGQSYVDAEKLKSNNIKLTFSDFKHPVYPQRFNPFIENISVIDLLFNCGPESSRILTENKELSIKLQEPKLLPLQRLVGQNKKIIIAGHQPEYLPYSGFIHKAMSADVFVLVDHIQYVKKEFQNRNKIRTGKGLDGWMWLTVPVITHGRFHQRICDVMIDNSYRWREKHFKSICQFYKNTPFFENYIHLFENVYRRKWHKLAYLDEALIKIIFNILGLDVKIIKSSDYNIQGNKTDMLIDLCKKLGADGYLSGPGGKLYMDESDNLKFKEAGLSHQFLEFNHPVYKQLFKPFLPYMSIIDMIFNCGPESVEIIKSSHKFN